MSILLGMDTATEACSVALLSGGECSEDYRVLPREHTRYLLPMVDGLLAERGVAVQDLDAIAFTAGPGSFTGLRVCAGVVQGLALGAELPVLPVSTLAVLAQTAVEAGLASPGQCVFSSLDARMDEVYWSVFEVADDGLVRRLCDDRLSAPEDVALPEGVGGRERMAVGSGLVFGERLPMLQELAGQHPELLPHAAALLTLAERDYRSDAAVPAEQAMPVYLRDKVAWR